VSPSPSVKTTCPICEGNVTISRYGEDLSYCSSCNFHFQNPSKQNVLYDRDYYARGEGFLAFLGKLKDALDYRSIFSSLKPSGKILDVGCGAGAFLSKLKTRGFEAWGMDTSASAVALATNQTSPGQVRLGPFSKAQFRNDFFDGAVCLHVIEHIDEPALFLKEIFQVLKPSATLVLRLPNFASWEARLSGRSWIHFDEPFHWGHYSPEAILKMAKQCGFQKVSVSPTLWEFKQALLYSLVSFFTKKPVSEKSRIFLLPLQVLLMPISFFIGFVFRNGGTIEVRAIK
jgi:2-polyprenyl-3-methyl-5-hydroxy-6-metoxy-1,4-benzoquinol methylase